jgi:hypothetical protein
MSCRAVKIKLFRCPVGLTITLRFTCQNLICLCLALSGSGLSATDNFGLHFWELGDHI